MSLSTISTSSSSLFSTSSESSNGSDHSPSHNLNDRVALVGKAIITTPQWSIESMGTFLGSNKQTSAVNQTLNSFSEPKSSDSETESLSEEELTPKRRGSSAAEEEDDEFQCISGTSSPLGREEATEDKVARIISFLEGSDLESIVYLLENADKQVKSKLTSHPKFMEFVSNNIQLRAFFSQKV